jgi:hypothetical protein
MRSNRVATLAVVAGLALLGSASAGVGGITSRTVGRAPSPLADQHDRDGDHGRRHAEHGA